MPPSRFRNVVGYVEDIPRARNNAASASGDSTACSIYQHQDIHTRHQNKLPKSVRYELENALVSLCDVWFDEIKPHLVRNNIKLHITGSRAGGDRQHAARSHQRAPPSSPLSDDCSHLDPGAVPDRPRRVASCANSWSPPPAVSSAPAARLRSTLRRPLSPLFSMPPTPRDGAQTHKCEKKPERPSIHRKRRRFRAQAQPSWRVPRLCRTHPVLSRGAGSPATMSASQLPSCDNYYRFIVPRRESVMKNKTTQTEPVLRVSRACQSRNPGVRNPGVRNPGVHNPCYCSSGSRSPVLRIPGLSSPVLRSPGPSSPGLRSPAPRSTKRSPTSSSPDSSSPDRALSPLVPPPPVICQLKRSEVAVAGLPPLLQDDLIDIIAASNENRLKLLYSSSEKDDHPSFLNLYPNFKPEKTNLKQLPPWK